MIRKCEALLLLVLFGGVLFMSGAKVYAEDIDASVAIRSYVEVVVPRKTELSIAPTSDGTFASTAFNVVTSTNNSLGYTVTMTADHTYLEANVVDPNTGENAVIQALDTLDNRDEDVFRNREGDLNRWGISIENANNYNPISLSNVVVNSNESAANHETPVNVGVKVNSGITPGTYSITLGFSAVAKIDTSMPGVDGGDKKSSSRRFAGRTLARSYETYYADVLRKAPYVLDDSAEKGYRTIKRSEANSGVSYYFAMQDMDPQVCSADVYDDSEVQAIDLRDGKVYWIAKLRDGNCWMTQNLDLELSSSRPLKHADSDIGWGTDTSIMQWTPTTTKRIESSGGMEGTDYYSSEFYIYNNYYFLPNSYDVGNWYFNGDDLGITGDCSPYLAGGCKRYRKNTPYQTNGTHGHVGNYYNWYAATAQDFSDTYAEGTLDDISNNPQNSICARGWRLPTASDESMENEGSTDEFTRLYYLYMGGDNIVRNPSSDTINFSVGDSQITNILKAPLFYTLAGNISSISSNPTNNTYGFYWTSTVNSNSYNNTGLSTAAYSLHITRNMVISRDQYPRIDGQSVRCIAR